MADVVLVGITSPRNYHDTCDVVDCRALDPANMPIEGLSRVTLLDKLILRIASALDALAPENQSQRIYRHMEAHAGVRPLGGFIPRTAYPPLRVSIRRYRNEYTSIMAEFIVEYVTQIRITPLYKWLYRMRQSKSLLFHCYTMRNEAVMGLSQATELDAHFFSPGRLLDILLERVTRHQPILLHMEHIIVNDLLESV